MSSRKREGMAATSQKRLKAKSEAAARQTGGKRKKEFDTSDDEVEALAAPVQKKRARKAADNESVQSMPASKASTRSSGPASRLRSKSSVYSEGAPSISQAESEQSLHPPTKKKKMATAPFTMLPSPSKRSSSKPHARSAPVPLRPTIPIAPPRKRISTTAYLPDVEGVVPVAWVLLEKTTNKLTRLSFETLLKRAPEMAAEYIDKQFMSTLCLQHSARDVYDLPKGKECSLEWGITLDLDAVLATF